ncbi:pyridoxamine kinase [Haloimpatiens sp. FM7315]|uniref:pyridoxamine kinase n=1 Tax=Haloimpatiens sp. FM7315 TaxID=3298609 RepID=UPI0035A2B918
MTKPIKRVAAIHDLSGFGRASLTTIIPILSTMGIQVCPLPTAILSTHSGGFKEFSFVDLTDSMESYINHWYKLNLDFDCIYSGFLGSTKQINIVSDFIDKFKRENTLVVIDPVMADNGLLYDTMDITIVENMRNLIKKANIITPNITEAAYILNEKIDYQKPIDKKIIKDWLYRLADMGPNIVIITSVLNENNPKTIDVVAYDKENQNFWKITSKYLNAFYPGTGDTFTSVLIGSILNGSSLPVALNKSTEFINQSLKVSNEFDYPNREGILLEKVLSNLNMPILNYSYKSF